MTEYACPNCRRVRRRKKSADSMVFRCSCVGASIDCPRVRWDMADWKLLNQPLADILGVGVHVVQKMRATLHKPRGTEGRKKHTPPKRRIDASRIDPRKSAKENALALNCTPERIRQLLRELNQKPNAEVSDAARHGVESPNSELGGVREH